MCCRSHLSRSPILQKLRCCRCRRLLMMLAAFKKIASPAFVGAACVWHARKPNDSVACAPKHVPIAPPTMGTQQKRPGPLTWNWPRPRGSVASRPAFAASSSSSSAVPTSSSSSGAPSFFLKTLIQEYKNDRNVENFLSKQPCDTSSKASPSKPGGTWWVQRTWDRLQKTSVDRWLAEFEAFAPELHKRLKESVAAGTLVVESPLEDVPPDEYDRKRLLLEFARSRVYFEAVNFQPEQYTTFVDGRPVQVGESCVLFVVCYVGHASVLVSLSRYLLCV